MAKPKSKLEQLIDIAERSGCWLYNPTSTLCLSPKRLKELLANGAKLGEYKLANLTWDPKPPNVVLAGMVGGIDEEVSQLKGLRAQMRREGIEPEYGAEYEGLEV